MTAAETTIAAGARGPGAPRLIVSDLDGTFLSPDGTVSARNAEAIRAAERAGITVMFATGRPTRWLAPITGLAGVHPLVIASNGAVLYDLDEGRVIDSRRIAVGPAADAVARIRAALPEAAFGVETGEQVGYEDHYQLGHRLDDDSGGPLPWVSRGRAEELVRAGEFVKLLVQHPRLDADALVAELAALVGDTMTVTHSVLRGPALAEISAHGVSKAAMLSRYCDRIGVPAAEVAGFGDMPNDAELLRWVGRPYVMADAHPALAGVGTVIGGNDESAVGETILGWIGRDDR